MPVFWALIVSGLVYRGLSLPDLGLCLADTVKVTAIVVLVIGATAPFAWLLTVENLPQQIATGIVSSTQRRTDAHRQSGLARRHEAPSHVEHARREGYLHLDICKPVGSRLENQVATPTVLGPPFTAGSAAAGPSIRVQPQWKQSTRSTARRCST